MPINKLDWITRKIKAVIGDPIISATTQEGNSVTDAIAFANVKYWQAFPHEYEENFEVSSSDTSKKYTGIEILKQVAFPDTAVKDKSFYIGILRIDQVPLSESSFINPVDSKILGKSVGRASDICDIDSQILNNTLSDLHTGEIDYKIDEINQNIEYILPITEGTVHVVHGFGFDDATLAYIPNNNLDIFAKIASLEFLEMILASRTGIDIQGDYTVNANALETKRNELREELSVELANMSRFPIIYA